jgi:hypothetical protein
VPRWPFASRLGLRLIVKASEVFGSSVHTLAWSKPPIEVLLFQFLYSNNAPLPHILSTSGRLYVILIPEGGAGARRPRKSPSLRHIYILMAVGSRITYCICMGGGQRKKCCCSTQSWGEGVKKRKETVLGPVCSSIAERSVIIG